MDIKSYLDEFSSVNCACGKKHVASVDKIIVEKGAINYLPQLIKEYSAKKVFVLCDVNTFEVAGKLVVNVLEKNGIAFSKYAQLRLVRQGMAIGNSFAPAPAAMRSIPRLSVLCWGWPGRVPALRKSPALWSPFSGHRPDLFLL